jgi:methionine-rich copper-binding protein CopC
MKVMNNLRRLRHGAVLLVATLATIGVGHLALAHDTISSSSPADRAQLDTPISQVTIDFGNPVNGVEIALIDPQDRELDGTVTQTSDTSARFDFAEITEKGQYIVRYLAEENGHLNAGAISFVYGTQSGPGASAITWIVVGLLAVTILAVGAFFSLRRSRQPVDDTAPAA